MTDVLSLVYSLAFIFTVFVMLVYYRRIRQASNEYAKAKTALTEIILSYDRDFKRQEEAIRDIAGKSERASAESLRALEGMDSEISRMKARLDSYGETQEKLLASYDVLRKNTDDLTSHRTEVLEKISQLESTRKERKRSEARTESGIPIGREQALAALTETELRIIELLANEGEKTALEIREGIRLTREHTSRLMKKLYARGYVERRTDRMPYAYSLKKEMGDLLKGLSPRD